MKNTLTWHNKAEFSHKKRKSLTPLEPLKVKMCSLFDFNQKVQFTTHTHTNTNIRIPLLCAYNTQIFQMEKKMQQKLAPISFDLKWPSAYISFDFYGAISLVYI